MVRMTEYIEHCNRTELLPQLWSKDGFLGGLTMARLIDADAFLKDILTAGIGKTTVEYSESNIAYMIRKRPTVDAVEVVRRRECKYHEDTSVTEYEHCCLLSKTVRYNDFCSYGERKEGVHNG